MSIDDWGKVDAGGFGEKTYLKDVIKLVDRKELKKFTKFRAIGPIAQYRAYWINIYKDGKPIPGKKGKDLQIPFVVTNFDGKTQTYDTKNPCPFAELAERMNKHLDDKHQCYESTTILSNFINRNAQDNLPGKIKPPSSEEEKTGFRNIDSKHVNPIEVMTFSANEYRKVKGTIELNEVKLKSGTVYRGPNDPKYGYDLQFKYVEEEKVASDKLKINKSERTVLSDEEKEYLIWDLDSAIETQIMKRADAKKEAERLWREFEKFLKASGKLKGGKKDEDEEDSDDEPEDLDDDEDEDNKKFKSKKKKKKVVDDDDEGEDEDDKPAKSKAKKKSSKRDDDEDEDEDEDEDDKKPVKKKKKASRDDDDDEDEEEKPKKKKKKVVDDDEDEDEDEDDEEDDKKSSKSKNNVKNKKNTKKKSKDDDDEDEDEDDDEDLQLDDDDD